jgi:FkbM family methyltransferase
MRKLIALMVLAAAIPAVVFWRPARMMAYIFAGRGFGCPYEKAMSARAHAEEIRARKDRILASSKLLETDQAGFEHWETPAGRYWIPKGSRFVLPFNLAEQDMQIYSGGPEARLRSGDIVLDCGANIGVYTRVALKAGASKVVAIEPAPENLECLRRNFAAEISEGKVVVYPKGVWDKDDLLTLHVHPENSAADSFVIEHATTHTSDARLPLTTIDKLTAELGLPRVDFIKMDIEGAEVRALDGGRATIARYHPRMAISAYHHKDHPTEIPRAVRRAWQDYRSECGPCSEIRLGIRPDVLYFY